jgi:hypothetical protein
MCGIEQRIAKAILRIHSYTYSASVGSLVIGMTLSFYSSLLVLQSAVPPSVSIAHVMSGRTLELRGRVPADIKATVVARYAY